MNVEHINTIDSTNEELKRRFLQGENAPLLIWADEQTAGKGRNGRSFYSPQNTGIYFSFLYPCRDKEMLGEYVSAFEVDLSRYERESIVSYDMQIEKRGQTYHGDYQVYVRNQELPSSVIVEDPDADPTLTRVTMEPPRVYIDIKDNKIFGRYYKSNPTSSADSFFAFDLNSPQVGYRAFPTGTISHDKITYTWSVDANADGWASISGTAGSTLTCTPPPRI